MKIKSIFSEKILPSILWLMVDIHSKLIRMQVRHNEVYLDLIKSNKPVVYVFWHGQLFGLIKYMASPQIFIMASRSKDGQLLASILKKFTFGIVYGSSNKQPVRALVNAIKVMKEGNSMAFAADGPKGPYRHLKPGAIFCAKKLNAPIIPIAVGIQKGWKFKSWDQFILPKYFSKCILLSGTPIYLNEETGEETVERDRQYIEEQLNLLVQKADDFTNF